MTDHSEGVDFSNVVVVVHKIETFSMIQMDGYRQIGLKYYKIDLFFQCRKILALRNYNKSDRYDG